MPYKDPERARAQKKEYWQRTKEVRRAKHREWYALNKQRVIDGVAEWRKANPGARSRQHRSSRYRLTHAEYDAMASAQRGLCVICEMPPDGKDRMSVLHVDHDHATGQVRDLLCHKCNKGLGAFRDRADLLVKAAMYLRRHAERQRESA